jgi:hypothetical protein
MKTTCDLPSLVDSSFVYLLQGLFTFGMVARVLQALRGGIAELEDSGTPGARPASPLAFDDRQAWAFLSDRGERVLAKTGSSMIPNSAGSWVPNAENRTLSGSCRALAVFGVSVRRLIL